MGNTAVVHFPGYFGKIELIINNQFFYPFNLMGEVKFFNGNTIFFRKEIGKIGVIVIEFFPQIIRKVYLDLIFRIMNQFNYGIFYFFNQDTFFIVHQKQTCLF